MYAIFELHSSYQPSLIRHSSFHMKPWLATLQPTCDQGSSINHRQRSNTADGIGTRPKTKKTNSKFAYIYKLLAQPHKPHPFCSAAPIASSTRIQYAISTAKEPEKVQLVRLTSFSKKSQWSRRHRSNKATKHSKKMSQVCREDKTRIAFHLFLCKHFENFHHSCELIHEVQVPQTIADLYQQKDHQVSCRDNQRQLDHNKQ